MSVQPIFGMNAGAWVPATKALGTIPVWRAYCVPSITTTGVPESYSHTNNGIPPSNVIPIISCEPNVQDFMTGKLDETVKNWVSGFPAGGCPVAYHEGDSGLKGLDPTSMVMFQHRWYQLIKNYRHDLLVGQISMGYTAWQKKSLTPWIAPGMDFQGGDIYKSAPSHTVKSTFIPWYNSIRAADPSVQIAITECNSENTGDDRPTYFKNLHTAAVNHRARFFMPFFGDKYPWDAADTATINELKTLMVS